MDDRVWFVVGMGIILCFVFGFELWKYLYNRHNNTVLDANGNDLGRLQTVDYVLIIDHRIHIFSSFDDVYIDALKITRDQLSTDPRILRFVSIRDRKYNTGYFISQANFQSVLVRQHQGWQLIGQVMPFDHQERLDALKLRYYTVNIAPSAIVALLNA